MCTAVSVNLGCNYFGRNLDFEYSFGERVVITPRNYKFYFTNGENITTHYSMIGMAIVNKGYPLYFDATNECGLSIAGLSFPEYAKYNTIKNEMVNIASFELIPYILCKCKDISQVRDLLKNVNITSEQADGNLKPTPLHWMISDKNMSIVLEQTKYGLKVYDNKTGVLTNSPSFDVHMINLSNHMYVSSAKIKNNITSDMNFEVYSKGMGGIGIPGDMSSMSRFVRAVFVKCNSYVSDNEYENLCQFFHILYSVYQYKGCVVTKDGYEMTHYTSCCNTDKGVYYYTTYFNRNINSIDMHKENLDAEDVIIHELKMNS